MNPRLLFAAMLAAATSGLPAALNPLNGTALPGRMRDNRPRADRHMTDADRERIAAAEAKRQRKASRRVA